MARNLWRRLDSHGTAHAADSIADALPPGGILSLGGADFYTDTGTSTDLDLHLRQARLIPTHIGGLYFRRSRGET